MSRFSASKTFTFAYGHRIEGHDGPCCDLHGHNARAVIVLENEVLDELGMVFDFADVKGLLMPWIDENLDHRMILYREDPFVPVLQELGEPLYLRRHRLESGRQTIRVRVSETPASAGIDPYEKLIQRIPHDNVVSVERGEDGSGRMPRIEIVSREF